MERRMRILLCFLGFLSQLSVLDSDECVWKGYAV